ncbi:MAG: hypothetical protein GY855_06010 [candidate division Zixibacteria bacterium]|nr:hypothetical protein [candidate division Zixibacteria bacterium]
MITTTKTLIILLILSSVALADYHYASHEGSNEYPYTSWETAADSISLAIDAADHGDTVYVGTGLYHDEIHLKKRMGLIGTGRDSCEIDGLYADDKILEPDNQCVIQGFSIRGKWGRTGESQPGILSTTDFYIIEDCRIYECYKGIYGAGEYEINNNLFERNFLHLSLLKQGRPLVINNTFLSDDVSIPNINFRDSPSVLISNYFEVFHPFPIAIFGNIPNRIINSNLIYKFCEYNSDGALLDLSFRRMLLNYNTIIHSDPNYNESDGIICEPIAFNDSVFVPCFYHMNPNPFGPTTMIYYRLPEIGAQPARIKIVRFNLISGSDGRVLFDGYQNAGNHAISWYTKDDKLSSGKFIIRLFWWGTEFSRTSVTLLK